MITLSLPQLLAAGALLGLWLAVAVIATIAGFRSRNRSHQAREDATRLARLIESAPAMPLFVNEDGRVHVTTRLAERLGLADVPSTFEELATAGFERKDALDLVNDVAAARHSGLLFSRSLRVAEGSRILLARGGPGPASFGRGTVLLWLFDATETQREIGRLAEEASSLAKALTALSTLIEAAPVPMWHRGSDLRLNLVNAAYVRAVEGVSAAEVVARGVELVEGEGGESPQAAAAAAMSAGGMIVRSVPATIGGARRMLRVVDVPLGEGGVAGYAVDMEEVEEARADLSRFHRAQRDMLDRLSAGVAQFGSDRSLVFWNRPFARLFALQPEWLSDRPEFDRVLERMREAGRLPESRDFPAWKEERRQSWFRASDEPVEENWLLPGGLHLRLVPQPLPDGGLLLVFEDRTEQVKLESARDTLLRVRTATFNTLFEAIGVFASDGRLSLWNNRFRDVWGLAEEELAKHPRVDTLVAAVAKRLVDPSRAGLIRELVRIATVERQQRSGRVALDDGRHFEFAAVPLPDGNALFTMLDVTDSRRIENALRERNEALEEGDKVKTAFVANMSYELRTPLTTIAGFAEMMQAGYAGELPEMALEYVGAIMASVSRLGSLIDQVLDLTQSGAGGLPMAEDQVDMADLAHQAGRAVQPQAQSRKIDLAVRVEGSAGMITGDLRRLRQAVDHVLKNAIGYTPPGGRVLFQVSGDASAVRIIVSDNGEGIPVKERARVFDRFHRTTLSTNDGERALGLGLPLTRQFVEAHGGEVDLVSEVGEGTTVTITLPRRRARR